MDVSTGMQRDGPAGRHERDSPRVPHTAHRARTGRSPACANTTAVAPATKQNTTEQEKPRKKKKQEKHRKHQFIIILHGKNSSGGAPPRLLA